MARKRRVSTDFTKKFRFPLVMLSEIGNARIVWRLLFSDNERGLVRKPYNPKLGWAV